MKKIFLILLVIVGLSSCDDTIKPINNSDKETTLEVLNNVDTTSNVAIIDYTVYIVKDGKVTHKVINYHSDVLTLIIIIAIFVVILLISLGMLSD